MKSRITNRLLFVVLTFALLAGVVFLFQSNILTRFDYKLKDRYFGSMSAPSQVSVIHVDPTSEQIYGQLLWNGELLAKLVDALDASGARVVALDLPLSWEGEYEEELQEAIRKSKVPIVLSSEIDNSGIQFPQQIFTQYAGVLSGYNNLEYGGDNRVRSTLLQQSVGDQKYNSFGLRILQHYYEIDEAEFAELPFDLGPNTIDELEHIINYYGPSRTIDSLSLAALLEGNDLSILENDVVIVGVSDPEKALLTPMGFMDKNEIQATVVANEINNHVIVGMDNGSILTTLAGIWLVFVVIHLLFSFRIATLLTVVFAVGYNSVAFNSFSTGYAIDIIHVSALVIGIWLIGFIASLFRLINRPNPMTKEFLGIINPKLLDKERHKLSDSVDGEKKEITYLSGSLYDLVEASKMTGPGRFIDFVNSFHSRSITRVFSHRGTVEMNSLGQVAAIWNAPLDDSHHAINAALTALELRDTLRELNLQHSRAEMSSLRGRFGISTGTAVVGNLGESEEFRYGAIGEPKDIAFKLMNLAPYYGADILVDRSVVEKLADKKKNPQFVIRWVDRVRFRGWHDSIDVFQLLTRGEVDDKTPDLIEDYEKALSDYLQGDFKSAAGSFSDLSSKYDDAASKLMAQRSETLVTIRVNWQGYWLID